MPETMNLVQKLAKVRSVADAVQKDKKGFNYSYPDPAVVLAKVKGGMQKYGVLLMPRIVQDTAKVQQNVITNTKIDKTGNARDVTTTEMLFSANMIFRWVNEDDPEDFIEVPWFCVGAQSDPSQAFGSGLSYCMRYFLMDFFQIAQVDGDIDAYRAKQKEAEQTEDRAIAEQIIEQFDIMVRDYLASHQEKSDAVKKFISRYVKNGNYKNIKEPVLASKLMTEFQNTYVENVERT